MLHVPQKKFKSTALRILGFVYWHIISFILGLCIRNVSVIVSPSPPLSIGMLNLILGKLKGCKVIYNVQEIYPDILKKKTGPVIAFLKKVERCIYNRSDAVTTIDDVLQNKAGGYTGSSGDQADLDFSIVGAMQQPGFGNNASAPAAEAKNLVILKNSSDEEKKGAYEFIKYFTTPENQAKWSMETGYVAVRKSTQDVKEFKDYTKKNPQALVPLQQASHGSVLPTDPTGCLLYTSPSPRDA